MQVEEILKKVQFFEYCTSQELETVLLYVTRRFFEPHSIVRRQGDTSHGLKILLRGSLKVFLTTPEGKELTLAILYPYECVGEMSLLDEKPASATISTIEETELLLLSREDFDKIINKVPSITKGIMKSLVKRIRRGNEQTADMAFLPPTRRLAKKLIELQHENVIEMTHQELASLVGTTRETVSRTLKQFEENGLIINERRRIKIVSLDHLESFSTKD